MDKELLQKIPTLQNTDVSLKTCIVRVDFNVPMKNGVITDPARIVAARPTIDYLISQKAKLVLLSHLSRVKTREDITSGKKSLKPVADALAKMYPNSKVIFVKDNTDKTLPAQIAKMNAGDIMLLENTRYNDYDLKSDVVVKRESKNDPELAKFWASLGDVYVNDAFATIHRGHASNAGIAKLMKSKCIGYLIANELENIVKFGPNSPRPIVSIVGGAKIADKIILLEKLMAMSDQVIIGGGMAHTFLAAKGIAVGKSLQEPEMYETAKALYNKYKEKILLPVDLKMTTEFADNPGKVYSIKEIPQDLMALDVGSETIKEYCKVIKQAQTIFWNGPTGVFEFKNYEDSTKAISLAVAEATKNAAFSLIGGGDTAAAACKFVDRTGFSFVSTGGGATLAVIQGDKLPGLFTK